MRKMRQGLYPELSVAAHSAVDKAMRNRLLPLTRERGCEECGEPAHVGHHDDYSQPLVLRYLCRKHHSDWHYGVSDDEKKPAVSTRKKHSVSIPIRPPANTIPLSKSPWFNLTKTASTS